MRANLLELKRAIERLLLKGMIYGCILSYISDQLRHQVAGLAFLSKLFFD